MIGLGGLGSHVAQQLAYLGVRRIRRSTSTSSRAPSMNRLVGASTADVAAKTKKVIVAKRMIEAINPDAIVEPVDAKSIRRRPRRPSPTPTSSSAVSTGICRG